MKKILLIGTLLCILLCCATGMAQDAIPEGHMRVTEVKLQGMTTLGDILAETDTGEEVVLPYPDAWFEDATLGGITMTGSIHMSFSGGETVFELGETLLKCTYQWGGEERILPLGVGTTLPYEKQGDKVRLSWADQSPEMMDRLAAQEAEEAQE